MLIIALSFIIPVAFAWWLVRYRPRLRDRYIGFLFWAFVLLLGSLFFVAPFV